MGDELGSGASGAAAAAQQQREQRGVYWKRNDSMRLVHLLIDPDLKVTERPKEREGERPCTSASAPLHPWHTFRV